MSGRCGAKSIMQVARHVAGSLVQYQERFCLLRGVVSDTPLGRQEHIQQRAQGAQGGGLRTQTAGRLNDRQREVAHDREHHQELTCARLHVVAGRFLPDRRENVMRL